jgi:hypothetical protein
LFECCAWALPQQRLRTSARRGVDWWLACNELRTNTLGSKFAVYVSFLPLM